MVARMPKRPREHVLETESRRALLNALPAEWTLSNVVNDYGLDERIEIFDGGVATGLGFGAQLKGTDEPNLEKALRGSFRISALNYMSAQAEPVLLVRYQSTTERLFATWLHRRNIAVKSPDQATITISWQVDEELTISSAPDLHEEVRRYRLFRSRVEAGLRVHLEIESRSEDERELLLIVLESLSQRAGGFLRFTAQDEPPDVTVRVHSQELFVDMSLVSAKVSVAEGTTAELTARNVLILAAICLRKLGREDVAAEIVTICSDAPVLAEGEIAGFLAGTFPQARRWRAGADLLSGASLASRSEPFATLLLLSLVSDPRMPQPDASYVVGALTKRADALVAEGAVHEAGLTYCNIGNLAFHSAYEWETALHAYERAADLSPEYLSRSYFCAELAGAHFENGHYRESTHWYETALRLDPKSRKLIAQRADAHSYAGEYEAALKYFAAYQESAASDDPAIWTLKGSAMDVVVQRTRITSQSRNPPEAARIVADVGDSAYDHAWQADALCIPAWLALGRVHPEVEPIHDALLIQCCYPTSHHLAPWPLLLILLHAGGMRDEFVLAVRAAWARGKEQLVPDLLMATTELDEELRTPLLRDVNSEVEQLRKHQTTTTIRFV